MAPVMPPPDNSQEDPSDTVLRMLGIAMLIAVVLLGRYIIVLAAWKYFRSSSVALSYRRDYVLPVLFDSPTSAGGELLRLNTARELIDRCILGSSEAGHRLDLMCFPMVTRETWDSCMNAIVARQKYDQFMSEHEENSL